ncbi:type II toxin-antitoxin system Phd/YefM family antitoxin [Ideonella azotifigens]|nr:type II toxin-antitoxin system prevent-host-death family antitoxin [Ideonella azotifigens]MCD2340188.1 type II toxin-antitoxin system Phd/YefM family antitoxin [Ideonella azotifigens]
MPEFQGAPPCAAHLKPSPSAKPIGDLKANAAEVLARPAEQREPLLITQNSEAKDVLQDVASFEETQETLARLDILALGNQDVATGKVAPAARASSRVPRAGCEAACLGVLMMNA